jgi:type 1 glutamine amidotransferase
MRTNPRLGVFFFWHVPHHESHTLAKPPEVSRSNPCSGAQTHAFIMKTCLLTLALLSCLITASAADKRILLLAGKQSHGPGDHEFRAGCLLLKKCLDGLPSIQIEVYTNGWPTSDAVFEGADAVVFYADGGEGHPAIQGDHPKIVDRLAEKGVGLGCMHYAVEVPKGEAGQEMSRWIGGYYEHQYSVNPMWVPNYTSSSFPKHPVTRGVESFALLDEWYFNMRWPEQAQADASLTGAIKPYPAGVTPILVATPSNKVRKGPYVYPPGPYDHIVAANGRQETMMWTFDRPNGGRSFGFTGGHKHVNWSNDNERKVVLNAILWIAKVEVPENGVPSSLRPEDLAANLDPKTPPLTVPNLTGQWTFHVETDNGSGDPSFTFVHAGQNLLGHYKGLFGEAVVFGSVERNHSVKLSFDVERQNEPVSITYTGKVESADKMQGKVKFGEREGTWTATKQ